MNIIRKFFSNRILSLSFFVILFILFLTISKTHSFISQINILGLLYGISANMIVAGAMTSLLISGGLDLSVGAVLTICMTIVAMLLKAGITVPIAIIITIVVGAAIGAIMGYIISYVGVNPFVVTLAGWFIIDSLLLIISGGVAISGFPKTFTSISNFRILNVPMMIIFAVISFIIFEVLLTQNKFFRQNFFIGGNEKAAELSGINVKKVKLLNYMITSMMAAIAGVMLLSRYNVSIPQAGSDTAFQIITAVVIGGASLKGGRGSALGTFIGLIFIALISDTLILYGVNIIWYSSFIGAILILIVALDANTSKILLKINEWEVRKLKNKSS